MEIRFFGGLAVRHDGRPVPVTGAMQRGLLFRLALDAGARVGYRALAEDLWGLDGPENPRASLQSIVSRLRRQLPVGTVLSEPGGYRLAVDRADVDAVRFQDLVAAARAVPAGEAARLASAALALWTADPWTPAESYDWFERALVSDRAEALRLGGVEPTARVTAPVPTAGLPAARTELVGREADLALVAAQLDASRLVTVVGPGGAGKTTLALEAARTRPHAVLVELAPVAAGDLPALWSAVAGAGGRDLRAVDAAQAQPVTPAERAVAVLWGRDVTLVLDNCEHLVDDAARVADELLRTLPGLRILATSREPLGVPEEAFVPLGALAPAAAGELFSRRVRAARGRAPEPGEQHACARIVASLDGLPLALELAAARARTMTPAEIAAGLDDRFRLLATGPRTQPRHQTLRALVDWSWELLTGEERRALGAVSAFPAGIAAGDVAAVARALALDLAAIDALVEKSMLQRSRGRIRALETIREYGTARLAEAGELTGARDRQADLMAAGAVAHDRQLHTAEVHAGLAWFDAEEENLAAAVRHCAATGRTATGIRLAAGSLWYLVMRNRMAESVGWFQAFAEGDDTEEGVLVVLVALAAELLGGHGTIPGLDAVREFLDRARRVVAGPGGRRGGPLVQLAAPALDALADALETARAPRDLVASWRPPRGEDHGLDPWPTAVLHVLRAAMAQNRGDVAVLGAESELAVELFTGLGDVWGLALSRQMRSEWLTIAGRLDEALVLCDESSRGLAAITTSWDLRQQQSRGVDVLCRLGRVAEARRRADAILAEARADDSPRSLIMAELIVAMVALAERDPAAVTAALDEAEAGLAGWPGVPVQVGAVISAARGAAAVLTGDLEAARAAFRGAAEQAVASADHPVIATVCLGIGDWALAAGRRDDARRALEMAVAARGAPDPTDLVERRLRAALGSVPVRDELDRAAVAVALAGLVGGASPS